MTGRERARLATRFLASGDGAFAVSLTIVIGLAIDAALHRAWRVTFLEILLAVAVVAIIRSNVRRRRR